MEELFKKYARDKNIIGIGTGKTMEAFSKYLPPSKIYVPTSTQSQLFMNTRNTTSPINQHHIDVYFDSADYYNERGDLIKGGGGALTQEKLFTKISSQIVIIVQKSKFIKNFQSIFVPIEILKPSYGYITNLIEKEGLMYQLRKVNDTIPFLTDLGNFIIDVEYNKSFLDRCKTLTGVVEHGYFENSGNFIIEEINDELE